MASDAASNVYSEVKDLMRDATKSLTSFTNKWKKFPGKLEEMYKSSTYVTLPVLKELPKTLPMVTSRKLEGIRKFEPKYPAHIQEKTSVRIAFVALKDDVTILAKHFFDDETIKASDVGEAAFNDSLERAKGSGK